MEQVEKYEAGLCNIGRQEISIRKKLFSFFLLTTIIMACLSCCWYQSSWMLILLFLSFFFTFLLLIEIQMKFCILFGLFNLYNFSSPGKLETVSSSQHSKKDRRKAIKILTVSSLAALLFTYLDYMVVIYLYF